MAFGAEQYQHVALPALVGAPAYSRPPRPVDPAPRPIDPDDFPLESEMTDDDRQLLAEAGFLGAPVLPPPALPPRGTRAGSSAGRIVPEARPFTVASVAGRVTSER